MTVTRQVITCTDNNGHDRLGTKNLAWRHDDQAIVSGSLLTVDPTQFCVLRSRGAVLNTYETGQYPLVTPDKPILGSFAQNFWSGSAPWAYEVIYINRAKLKVSNEGDATTSEMALVHYVVDYYIHIDTKQGALDLTTHLPFSGAFINTAEIADYAGPAIEQAINQVIQVTPLEHINEKINELREQVKGHLEQFLSIFGIHLNDLKILVMPKDPAIQEIISLRALGLKDADLPK